MVKKADEIILKFDDEERWSEEGAKLFKEVMESIEEVRTMDIHCKE